MTDVLEQTSHPSPSSPLLTVNGLNIRFETDEGTVHVVDDLSFVVNQGETLGIVGESGSGKSVTSLSLLRLLPSPPARVDGRDLVFESKELQTLSEKEMREIRGKKISMIFQDPMTSLNPFMRISQQLEEVLETHDPGLLPSWHARILRPLLSPIIWGLGVDMRICRWFARLSVMNRPIPVIGRFFSLCESFHEWQHNGLVRYRDPGSLLRRERCVKMLERVGIPDAATRIDDYPHQFSGGMRQRVMVAMALLCQPRLLIADEPTTALDVTIQAQILELVQEIKEGADMSVILVTHDLGVVAGTADRVMVMYAGKMMEVAPTEAIFSSPSHPYTLGLLRCLPRMEGDKQTELYSIEGSPPDLSRRPSGCPFHPRCSFATDLCRERFPDPVEIAPGHISHCWAVDEVQVARTTEAV